MAKFQIETIAVATTDKNYFDGSPMKETVTFWRSGHTNEPYENGCHAYYVDARRDSFWRAIRAMKQLTVNKHNPRP